MVAILQDLLHVMIVFMKDILIRLWMDWILAAWLLAKRHRRDGTLTLPDTTMFNGRARCGAGAQLQVRFAALCIDFAVTRRILKGVFFSGSSVVASATMPRSLASPQLYRRYDAMGPAPRGGKDDGSACSHSLLR